jgi:uncharacterized protein (TIGR03437 family)
MAAVILLAALCFGPIPADSSGSGGGPTYSASSIANSAASIANYYAPNTFISIYGQNLSTVTQAMTSADITGGLLPTTLGGVHVLINAIPADVWYVSPTLVNVLVPSLLVAGTATVQVVQDGIAGPPVQIMLGATAPALFQTDATTALATHLDGTLVSSASPANPGETIVLWAGGLGATTPAAIPNQLTEIVSPLAAPVQILLNGTALPAGNVEFAGAVVGYAGLYQINLVLPADVAANPEIQIATPDQTSPPGRYLMVQ